MPRIFLRSLFAAVQIEHRIVVRNLALLFYVERRSQRRLLNWTLSVCSAGDTRASRDFIAHYVAPNSPFTVYLHSGRRWIVLFASLSCFDAFICVLVGSFIISFASQ